MLWWLLGGLALLSWGFTGALRQYAHTRWLDMPNERSSHVEPTPHGGGLAVVVTFFVGLLVLLFAELVSVQMVTGFAGAGALVAVVGFWDDHAPLPARWRLLAHIIAAAWGVYWLGGLPELSVWGHSLALAGAGDPLWVLGLAGLLDVYNVVDGFDG